MKLSNDEILPMFIIGDTFNRVVFVSQGYTIGLGEQMMKIIHKLSYTAIGRHIYKRLKCVSSMRKKWQHYSAEECLRVLRDYYSSGLTKGGCCRKYGIRNKSTLTNWLRKYEFHPELLSLRANPIEEDMANRDKESYKEENAALKKRIKELEKALAFSRLETEARDLMIDKAESYFNIPIRKKSGAKQ